MRKFTDEIKLDLARVVVLGLVSTLLRVSRIVGAVKFKQLTIEEGLQRIDEITDEVFVESLVSDLPAKVGWITAARKLDLLPPTITWADLLSVVGREDERIDFGDIPF